MKKLVSIIVPAYNVAPYLEHCLLSVIHQTYSNLEIVVIDDGSEDDTLEIAYRVAKTDERITVLHQENSGVSAARNRALAQAKGFYCAFVDGDDSLEPDAIEVMVDGLEREGADWLNCQYHRVTPTGERLESYQFIKGLKNLEGEQEKFEFLFRELLVYLVGYEVWNKLYCMDIIRENKLHFAEGCRIGEDLGFNICYTVFARKLLCIEDRCYNYCVRGDSAMSQVDSLRKNMEQYVRFLSHVYETLQERSDCSWLKEHFYLLFVRTMENAQRGYPTWEIAQTVETLSGRDFYIAQAREIVTHKKEMETVYEGEEGKLRFRSYLSILKELEQSTLSQRIYLEIYALYRKLKGREDLSKMKQP